MHIIYHILEKQRDKVKQDPDIKDKKGTQPDVYYKGLKKSTKDKRDAHFKKGAKMDDDNPAAYKPAPGDANAKTKPSKHTKKFDKMFGEGKEEYIMKKGKFTRKVDGKTADKMKRQGWKLVAKENIAEGKLVANFRTILDVMTNQLKKEVGKRYQKSEESGIKLMNDIGSMMGYKVTNKSQEKNKLFLKFGEGSTGLHFQEEDEDTMPDLDESLWKNIHNKRKRGEKMRKPGEKGAPKPGDFKRARGED